MSAEQVTAYRTMYRRQMEEIGETVTLRRSGTSDVTVLARVMGYKPEELAGGIIHGDRRIILTTEDVAASAFPEPLKAGDQIIVRGRTLRMESVDTNTRRIGDTLIAYDIQARG